MSAGPLAQLPTSRAAALRVGVLIGEFTVSAQPPLSEPTV